MKKKKTQQIRLINTKLFHETVLFSQVFPFMSQNNEKMMHGLSTKHTVYGKLFLPPDVLPINISSGSS